MSWSIFSILAVINVYVCVYVCLSVCIFVYKTNIIQDLLHRIINSSITKLFQHNSRTSSSCCCRNSNINIIIIIIISCKCLSFQSHSMAATIIMTIIIGVIMLSLLYNSGLLFVFLLFWF